MEGKVYLSGACVCYNTPDPAKRHTLSNEDRNKGSKKQKIFKLKFKDKVKIVSSSIHMRNVATDKMIFFTLTYQKDEFPTCPNKDVGKFLDNTKKNYGLNRYIWVKELTKIGTPHYHFIAEIPYVPYKKLNDAWCAARGYDSPNAFRGSGVIKSVDQSAGYVSKYISKQRGIQFLDRCYAISHNALYREYIEINDKFIEKYREKVLYDKPLGDYAHLYYLDRKFVKELFEFYN